jgi:competence protein ComEA
VGDARNRTWLWIAAAALAAAAAYALLGTEAAQPGAAPRVAVDGPRAGGSAGARLWVHVSGEVRRPGLYRLPPGSRVGEAVQRAGGPSRRAELGGVNLAALLRDGQQVAVPRRGAQVAAAAGTDGAAAGAPAAPISLGTATAALLDGIDGIGPTLAGRIVQYRESHGGFRSIDDLREVEGIGEKRFEALREALQP